MESKRSDFGVWGAVCGVNRTGFGASGAGCGVSGTVCSAPSSFKGKRRIMPNRKLGDSLKGQIDTRSKENMRADPAQCGRISGV